MGRERCSLLRYEVYEAIKEFGWDNIKKEILLFLPDENGNSEKITSLEKEFIKAYSGRCYNSMSDPEWYEENPGILKRTICTAHLLDCFRRNKTGERLVCGVQYIFLCRYEQD